MNICVYSSSSDAVDPVFFAVAKELGAAIAERGHTLVYGGARVGLMGELARSARSKGARIVGVIPKSLKGLAFDGVDELITARDMRERKAMMAARADAFVALPGGFGTLEETIEVLALKQLGEHDKPVILLNTDGFYGLLNDLFEHLYRHHFAKADFRRLYYFAPSVPDVFRHLDGYKPVRFPRKWYEE